MKSTIYILGIIVWVIYNVYKASQKAKEAKPAETKNTEDRSDEVKEIIRKALEKKKEKVRGQKPEVRSQTIQQSQTGKPKTVNKKQETTNHPPKKIKQVSQDSFKDIKNEGPSKESLLNFSEAFSPILQEHTPEESNELMKDFDPRKAVIYAEIMKRPDWINN